MEHTSTNGASSTADPQIAPVLLDGLGIDLKAWRATADKLSLRETGELVRSLVRASTSKRPNREQRMLLAIFTRASSDDEEAA
jgi:hypothetical protein